MRLALYLLGLLAMAYMQLEGMLLVTGLTVWALVIAATSEQMSAVVGRFLLYAIVTAAIWYVL